jgi:hypothetical protein
MEWRERLVVAIEKIDAKINVTQKGMKAGQGHLKEEMLAKMETYKERLQSRKDGSQDRHQE